MHASKSYCNFFFLFRESLESLSSSLYSYSSSDIGVPALSFIICSYMAYSSFSVRFSILMIMRGYSSGLLYSSGLNSSSAVLILSAPASLSCIVRLDLSKAKNDIDLYGTSIPEEALILKPHN